MACVCFALLPLGGVALLSPGSVALGATSSGAKGDIAFVRGGSIYLTSTGASFVTGTDPSWSPDGTELAYVDGGVIKTICVTTCSGSPGPTAVAGTQPVWSPSTTTPRIAYVLTSTGEIHVMDPNGSNDTSLGQTGTEPTWSPDGTQIAFTQAGAIATVVVASPATVTPITTNGVSGSSQPAWSPDGTTIAFQTSVGGHSQIYVVPAAGGSATAVTSSTPNDDETAPSWSPDGASIVYADNVNGIESVTQGTGGAWQTPTPHTTNAGDLTPDWQTAIPIKVAAPSITGGFSPQTGQLLSATTGSWNGANTGGFSYVWQRCDSSGNNCSAIGGATSSTYAVVSADVAHTLRVIVTASNSAGSTASSPSNATGVVTQAGTVNPPSNTVYPTINLGTGHSAPLVGSLLTSTTGTWTGSFPMTFTYQWKFCDSAAASCFDIKGATSSFYTVPAIYYGKVLRVQVTATNSAASVSQNSLATPVVTEIAPKLRVTPQITGQTVVDQTLTLGAGTWDGSPAPTFTYSWRRCNPPGDLASCVPIAGATLSTYSPKVADIGFTIRVWITGANLAGSDVGVTNHTFPIIDKKHFSPSTLSAPSIAGTIGIGRPLSAFVGSFNGDAPITTSFVWQRCDATGQACRTIPDATKLTYEPTANDLGSTLRLAITAKNAYGTMLALSDPTEPVLASPPRRRGRRIVGTARGNYLAGGGWDDTILGLGGNDTLMGGAGDDSLNGGAGKDVITGGAGNDKILGSLGSDTVYAADGEKDVVDCGAGNDRAVVDAIDVVKHCEVVQIAATSGSGGAGTGGSTGGTDPGTGGADPGTGGGTDPGTDPNTNP